MRKFRRSVDADDACLQCGPPTLGRHAVLERKDIKMINTYMYMFKRLRPRRVFVGDRLGIIGYNLNR